MNKTCVELFAGCGGASLGLHQAGFRSLLAVEWDEHAHATLAAARLGDAAVCGDVRDMSLYAGLQGKVDLVWSSPPCQAWSTSGKRLGAFDERNGWPWTWDVVDHIRPRWLLCENVTGMRNHRTGCPASSGKHIDLAAETTVLGIFGSDTAEASLPPPEECPGCYWERVVLAEARARFAHVSWKVLNAADYGVPQCRERVILMAGPAPLRGPPTTHSLETLVHQKQVSMAYWHRHGIQRSHRWSYMEKGSGQLGEPAGEAWVTVRDVLAPFSEDVNKSLWVQPHQLKRTQEFQGKDDVAMNPDLPSSTVTCRRGGAKTNDALILDVGGRLRYLTPREVSVLQAFPPNHPWQGGIHAQYKQIGNAVPPPVAEALGRMVLSR